jgi:phosphohistidine phosphatase
MKQLTILRHAKAERPEGFATDLERPLSARGHKDAAAVAALVAALTPSVDWIVSSPALRTRETVKHLVQALNFKHKVVWDDSVYDASADALLGSLSIVPPDVEHTLLVGHNPGLQDLISGLCAGAPSRLNVTMATGAFAFVNLEIFWWNQIRWGCGALHLLVKPKLVRE